MSTSSIVVFTLQLLTTLILARIFSPEEFGIVSAVTIIISYTDIFWMMGIGPAIVQKKKLDNTDIKTGFTVSFIFGIICFVLVYLLAPYLTQLLKIEEVMILRIIALSFILNSFGVVSLSLLQRNLRFKIIVVKDIISTLSYGFFAIFLGILGFGVWGLVIALLIKYFVATGIAWFMQPIENPLGFSKSSFKKLIHFGGGYTISRFFSVTANQGDYFVIARTLGAHSLGLYNRAYQLMAIPAHLMGQVIDQVFFPVMSKIQNQNNRLSNIFILLTTVFATIYLPMSVLIFLLSEELIIALLGEQWIEASVPLKYLALFLFFRVGYKICDPIFRAKGFVYNRAVIQIIYAMMVVIFSYIGSQWGLIGISLGVALSLVCNYTIMVIITYKLINFNIKDFLRSLIPVILFMFSVIPFLIYLKNILNMTLTNNLMVVLLIIIIFSAWAFLSFIIIYFMFWSEFTKTQVKIVVNYMLNRIKK